MAPEQSQARHDKVGPPADVYALGAILQEMLTGSPPSAALDAGGDEPRGCAAGPDVMARARPIPPALGAIVARCLEPEPGDRYQDATELAADLSRLLAGRHVEAAAWPSRRLLRAWASRRSSLAATLMSIALIVAAARVLTPPRDRPADGAHGSVQMGRYVDDLSLAGELLPWEQPLIDKPAMARALLERHRPHPGDPDLRSFEWHHLWRRLHGERKTLEGHRGAVYLVRFSPDGRSLASAGHDGARIWDVAAGTLKLVLREHADEVNWVSFSPDGRQVATASDDRTVGVWSAADGRRLLPPLAHRDKVVAVLFTPDGRRLIAGDRGGEVRVWDVATGGLIRQIRASDSALDGPALSSDGSILATAASEVKLWDYPSFRDRGLVLPADPGLHFGAVAISHDGRRFATADGSVQQVRVWDLQTGRLVLSLAHPAAERVMSVAFSPNDRMLVSSSADRTARLWEIPSGGLVATVSGHTHWIWCGDFAPDGSLLATGGGDGTIKLWALPQHGRVVSLEPNPADCLAIGHSADGRHLLTATDSGRCAVWDVESGRLLKTLPLAPGKRLVDAAFSPGASLLATVDAEGTLAVGSPHRAVPSIVRLGPRPPIPTWSSRSMAGTWRMSAEMVRWDGSMSPVRRGVSVR